MDVCFDAQDFRVKTAAWDSKGSKKDLGFLLWMRVLKRWRASRGDSEFLMANAEADCRQGGREGGIRIFTNLFDIFISWSCFIFGGIIWGSVLFQKNWRPEVL